MSRPMSVRRVALFAAFAASVFSIASPAAPMAAQTPAVTGSTSAQSQADDVMLDLAVHDRRNRPVLDLRPGDITVTDNGKPVRLADLHLVNGDQKSPRLITLLFDRPGLQDPKTKSEDSLFDISASSVQETSKKLRQEGMKFLKAFPAGKFQFAVMDVWGRLQIQEAFNQNLKSVAEAIPAAVEPQVYGTVVTANELEKHLAQVAITGLEPAGAAASVWDRSLARSMYTALCEFGSDRQRSASFPVAGVPVCARRSAAIIAGPQSNHLFHFDGSWGRSLRQIGQGQSSQPITQVDYRRCQPGWREHVRGCRGRTEG